jgi:hypothetical protein
VTLTKITVAANISSICRRSLASSLGPDGGRHPPVALVKPFLQRRERTAALQTSQFLGAQARRRGVLIGGRQQPAIIGLFGKHIDLADVGTGLFDLMDLLQQRLPVVELRRAAEACRELFRDPRGLIPEALGKGLSRQLRIDKGGHHQGDRHAEQAHGDQLVTQTQVDAHVPPPAMASPGNTRD